MSVFKRVVYPFTAIIGQEKMKKALILNAINTNVGGVLIFGEKGTAKSTTVRSLAALLPEINVVKDCFYNCNPEDKKHLCDNCKEHINNGELLKTVSRKIPIIELPISTTEDRLIGSLDFEYAIKNGKCKFSPGILGEANNGIIYIDEVNLLDDRIVDLLLDAAAMGINVVERENISFSHPAHFILIGTMNPEEGDLRPQLLDRFGICVEVKGIKDPFERIKVIKNREAFDKDPIRFNEKYVNEEQELREKIIQAKNFINKVVISDKILKFIAELCMKAFVQGHRADIFMEETSRTIAAYYGHKEVTEEDVKEASELVLLHRIKKPSQSQKQQKKSDKNDDHKKNKENQDLKKNRDGNKKTSSSNKNNKTNPNIDNKFFDGSDLDQDGQESQSSSGDKKFVFSIGNPFQVKSIANVRDRVIRKGSGRRSYTKTSSKVGRYIKSTITDNNDLAIDATLRASAPYQIYRFHKDAAVAIESHDIRYKLREKHIGNFILFVVDASGSMGVQKRMIETKGAILSLLLDTYQKRDKIGMIVFKDDSAEVILPPTSSVELAYKLLEKMPTGGKTPLSAGLYKAYKLSKFEILKDPDISPILVVISDGKGNVSMGEDKPLNEVEKIAADIKEDERITTLVIDVEKENLVTFGLAKKLSQNIGGKYFKIEDLKANNLIEVLKENIC
ncbi:MULTISPECIES: putative cobaltochelatase [Clostridium]|uniref:Mg-protoporphyrin IX chelatase n=1 Tax=Clostridium ragsdalei P11 TaxID=1353534 RepID=A0A1A6B3Y7_9CLOT|nr:MULTISPECIES: putative cobaltochelatase [Clostridium]OBR96983.1 magnesium-chelatase 38 kDa subunit [Clostridium ragsdalei P11]QXE17595.1 magnesium chelatase [Clostridium sp. 001]